MNIQSTTLSTGCHINFFFRWENAPRVRTHATDPWKNPTHFLLTSALICTSLFVQRYRSSLRSKRNIDKVHSFALASCFKIV